jgi:hypothetical protein
MDKVQLRKESQPVKIEVEQTEIETGGSHEV